MEEKKFTLFGTDLQKIPCFKKTFTISTYSGIAAGLGCFLITSRIKKSADVAVLTFAVTTVGYWFYCRYNWSKQYQLTQQMNSSLHNVMLNEGAKKESSDV
ncbi:cytochrome c oxidase assembly protein COX20, mitochondrial-like [Argiope bruennichi]|uniref:Cytochrome c oxidase assembly protein COX20, mitochondrial n=1 Tax=Argiope bruennichi TaxID=94029 RepID=A0A8T0FLJ6_ARGBR|nr:cytochrome c oxidase assembly protein COX20, mitochondrial-like [Argiope bruennichi]KAF8790260.1 Cytochrome c oxidase assembly protein COX20 like protein [Argiope bruennichi]